MTTRRLLMIFVFGRNKADKIEMMERERKFFFENAVKWAEIYFEAIGRSDHAAARLANIAFRDCQRRHRKLCHETNKAYSRP